MSQPEKHPPVKPRPASQWICQSCQRHHRTNFCPNCGTPRPDETSTPEKSFNALHMLLAHCRSVEQSNKNAESTAIYRGGSGWKERVAAEKWKLFADSLEWGINELSG